jgi:hypothetical protein
MSVVEESGGYQTARQVPRERSREYGRSPFNYEVEIS